MIEWTSIPYLWGPVSSHGTLMAIGIGIAALLGRRDAKRAGIDVERFDNVVLLAILGGVVGARLLYILLHLRDFETIWDILKVWKGGLSSFGGLLGGFLSGVGYLKWKGESWLKYADAVGPHILLGWGIGRIGDLLLWSEFGTPTGLPWGFAVDGDMPRHPTQIYELISLSVLWVFVLWFRSNSIRRGTGFLFYFSMFLYFAQRFLIEFIRDYPGETSIIDYRFFAQAVSLAFAIVCLYKMVKKSWGAWRGRFVLLTFILVLTAGCAPKALNEPNALDALPSASTPEIIALEDDSTFDLTASMVSKTISGKTVTMMAYNGSIPGPVLKVSQGAHVTVRFTNALEIPTTLHSHGVRLDNAFDGVPDVTQEPILPGETFTYELTFPDDGVFWYHPHLREDWAQEMGLYGNFWVVTDDANAWPSVNVEIPLFVDDLLMDENGVAPFYDHADHALMGRFGNTFLVNGDADYALTVQKGSVIRFYFTNSANTRTFKLSIPQAKMKLIGGDNGRYEQEIWQDHVVLGPSERAIVDVFFESAGDYPLVHTTPGKTVEIGQITVSDETAPISYRDSFKILHTDENVITEMNLLGKYIEAAPDKELLMTVDMMAGMGGMHSMHDMGEEMMDSDIGSGPDDGIEWEDLMGAMNTASTSETVTWILKDALMGNENHAIQWSFNQGDYVKIRIKNDGDSMHPMQHPLHFHGQRFVILAVDGEVKTNQVWKDTALIPSGATVDILLEASNPGQWMAHCHIAEHLEARMMLSFEVMP